MNQRIGIDVGGTFTDFVLLDPDSGRLTHYKEPSTPADPARAVETGIRSLLEKAGASPADIALIVHGTTLSLNAILQRRGARLALVVSRGNRDLLEIARVKMTHAFDFYTMPEAPLVPRDRVIEIDARLDRNGTPWLAPDDAEIARVANALKASQPDAVAVVLLNAYVDPGFEQAVSARLQAVMGAVPVVASTEIWSEMREYERAVIGVMNAYVTPTMQSYYSRLEAGFERGGFTAPLSITTSNGGTIDLPTARARPIDTILSGPASGVVAAIDMAQRAGIGNIITFDMGGTSADIAIAEARHPEITTSTMIGELPLILPVVNVGAIGSGGGSVVRLDPGGLLKVGPESAGADPGPACYGRGGAAAAMTDCYLLCGFIDPERFLEGRLKLSPEASEAVLAPIGQALWPDEDQDEAAVRAADAAIRVASSMMATEIRKALARRGNDIRDFTLVPYGGAGPTHAALLAEEAGIDSILVAASPGTLCALGATVANLRRDFVRSFRLTIASTPSAEERASLGAAIEGLAAEARGWIASVGDRVNDWRMDVSADLRYPGQGFDLSVTLRDFQPGMDLATALADAFHKSHHDLYDFNETDSAVEINRLVFTAIGLLPEASLRQAGMEMPADAPSRRIWVHGGWISARSIPRAAITPGTKLAGPLVIAQSDTTIIVPPHWTVDGLADGSLMMTRIPGAH